MNRPTCTRDGCDRKRGIHEEYCERCQRFKRQQAAAYLLDSPEPIPPEDVPERTHEEMQKLIDELKAEAENA